MDLMHVLEKHLQLHLKLALQKNMQLASPFNRAM
jgi:hypothetical protein